MRRDLVVELVTEHNDVLEFLRKHRLIWLAVVPDLRLAKEVEPRSLHYLGGGTGLVGSEKDRGPKDPFKCSDQPPVLCTPSVQAEGLEHLTCTPESDNRALLLNGKGGQEDRNNTVLTERYAKVRMTRDL